MLHLKAEFWEKESLKVKKNMKKSSIYHTHTVATIAMQLPPSSYTRYRSSLSPPLVVRNSTTDG